MKIGLITNLVNIESFVRKELFNTNAENLMKATGGNTGNVAFVQGISNLFGSDVEVNVVHWGDSPQAVNSYYDRLVVCCANQLGSHVDLGGWAKKLKEFGLPTVFIGLGAQSDKIGQHPELPQGTVDFLKATSELRFDPKVPNIITRGEFSKEVAEQNGARANAFGCPSLFISHEKALGEKCFHNQAKVSFPRIMSAAGNLWHSSRVIEKLMVELVQKYKGEYVLQHPQCVFELAMKRLDNLTPEQKQRTEEVYSYLGDLEHIADWFRAYGVYFADAQNWINYSKKFSFAIGPRYHGVALPIQAGVAGKVIAIDSRTEELSRTTGIPVIHYKDVTEMSAESLFELCSWNMDESIEFDQIRTRNASNYNKFLEANGLKVAKTFELLAQD